MAAVTAADFMIWQSRNTPPCPIVGMTLGLRGAPHASSARERVGSTLSVGAASTGVENGGAGRCLTATFNEARRG